jgi:hypothetical protein
MLRSRRCAGPIGRERRLLRCHPIQKSRPKPQCVSIRKRVYLFKWPTEPTGSDRFSNDAVLFIDFVFRLDQLSQTVRMVRGYRDDTKARVASSETGETQCMRSQSPPSSGIATQHYSRCVGTVRRSDLPVFVVARHAARDVGPIATDSRQYVVPTRRNCQGK